MILIVYGCDYDLGDVCFLLLLVVGCLLMVFVGWRKGGIKERIEGYLSYNIL